MPPILRAVPLALAIDIGGTKFEVALVGDDGSISDRHRVASSGATDGEELFSRLTGLVERLDLEGVDVCGVGAGGPMRKGGEAISPLNIAAWRDFPLRSRLEELTGMAVYGDLDAKALALAEGWLGAAQGHPNFLAITVSASVSGAIVLDGDLLDGETGNAGQIGHVVVEPGGRRCHCGTQGCLDAETSGEAIDAITGRPATEPSFHIMQRTGRLVGRASASMCNAFDLSLVVVGGSVALGFGSTFFHAAQVALDDHARLPYSRGARITPSRLGEHGPLIGAGAVGWRGVRRRARQQPVADDQPPTTR